MNSETLLHEQIVRKVYRTVEIKDTKAFVSLFEEGGYFWDISAGGRFYREDIGKTVNVYAKVFFLI